MMIQYLAQQLDSFFLQRLLDALTLGQNWNSQNLKKLLWSLSADAIYFHLTVAGNAYGM